MRKSLAGIVLALSFAFSTFQAEPAHAATYPTQIRTYSNLAEFKRLYRPPGHYAVSGQAYRWNNDGLQGYAALYVNGVFKRAQILDHGWFGFRTSREHLRDNRSSRITVKIVPRNRDYETRWIYRWVKDVTEGMRIVTMARMQVGDRYVWGAAGPDAFDCSGLVVYAYRHTTGQTLPHGSARLRYAGRRVYSPRAGDIVWTPGHVSIYAGGGMVVEAANARTDVRYTVMWQRNPVYVRP
jgi:peptidoglycan DL-endopeptidase CwlO